MPHQRPRLLCSICHTMSKASRTTALPAAPAPAAPAGEGAGSPSASLSPSALSSAPKITIRLLSIGSTPSVKPAVVSISGDRPISAISQFLCKKLKARSVHVYIQNTFEPGPDEIIGDLHLLFRTNNELIVSYCLQVAFG